MGRFTEKIIISMPGNLKGKQAVMNTIPTLAFDAANLFQALQRMDDASLDALAFGVIGFDRDAKVRRYNRYEMANTGLTREEVLDHHVFTEVAQCMNNYLVAQRFEDAAQAGQVLDATLHYVLTWRMRPTPVELRLLAEPGSGMRYLLLLRLS